MAKLKRSALLHYINATPKAATPSWFLIGKNVEDMSVELNPDVETTKNILDETVATHNGYEPSMDVDTYYADPADSIYDLLSNIAMNRLTGDECKTQVLEILVDDTSGANKAWIEDCLLEVTSYGGAQGGVQIPYTVHYDGNRVAGTATITNKIPEFSASTVSSGGTENTENLNSEV